jgi:hypothetical protein
MIKFGYDTEELPLQRVAKIKEANPIRINSSNFENSSYTIELLILNLQSNTDESLPSYTGQSVKCIAHIISGSESRTHLKKTA